MRWLIPLVATVLVISLLLHPLLHKTPSLPANTSPPAFDWDRLAQTLIDAPEDQSGSPGILQVGAYVTNLSDLDLLENRFSVQLFLWSIWSGPEDQNPSDDITVLNGIHDGDVQRFERVRRESRADGRVWSLYRIRTQAVQRWQLSRYPFDSQHLKVEIGFLDPLNPTALEVVPSNGFSLSPGLILPGWLLHDSEAFPSQVSLMSDLGSGIESGLSLIRQHTVVFQMHLERVSLLWFTPDFLGYILAVGLCCMALLISRSRDDLILAAVVSAGGNYVFIAGKLPVTAMSGFIGNLQIIIFLGILYVVGADEVIDNHLAEYSKRVSGILRRCLLPSYLAFTLFGVYLIIPSS
ncbi:hypothetical protein [Synechococcus sp. MU1625]|uniref:hypothetical protein n=1 Tax=Synechococcus sp. MU1625 TaxID=2508347 RepID=UPI001CF8A046|nr:hypothetical protein [Synechococcus sp. MU1625]